MLSNTYAKQGQPLFVQRVGVRRAALSVQVLPRKENRGIPTGLHNFVHAAISSNIGQIAKAGHPVCNCVQHTDG